MQLPVLELLSGGVEKGTGEGEVLKSGGQMKESKVYIARFYKSVLYVFFFIPGISIKTEFLFCI